MQAVPPMPRIPSSSTYSLGVKLKDGGIQHLCAHHASFRMWTCFCAAASVQQQTRAGMRFAI
eukprot:3460759-Amphidinium_carterae.4